MTRALLRPRPMPGRRGALAHFRRGSTTRVWWLRFRVDPAVPEGRAVPRWARGRECMQAGPVARSTLRPLAGRVGWRIKACADRVPSVEGVAQRPQGREGQRLALPVIAMGRNRKNGSRGRHRVACERGFRDGGRGQPALCRAESTVAGWATLAARTNTGHSKLRRRAHRGCGWCLCWCPGTCGISPPHGSRRRPLPTSWFSCFARHGRGGGPTPFSRIIAAVLVAAADVRMARV